MLRAKYQGNRNQEWEKLYETLEKKIESNLHSSLQQILSFLKDEPNNREPVINKALEYWLKNDLFQQEKIDTHKLTALILEAALQSKSVLNQPESIKKLIEKYGLDKDFIIYALEEKRKAIELLISELGGLGQTEQASPAVRKSKRNS